MPHTQASPLSSNWASSAPLLKNCLTLGLSFCSAGKAGANVVLAAAIEARRDDQHFPRAPAADIGDRHLVLERRIPQVLPRGRRFGHEIFAIGDPVADVIQSDA